MGIIHIEVPFHCPDNHDAMHALCVRTPSSSPSGGRLTPWLHIAMWDKKAYLPTICGECSHCVLMHTASPPRRAMTPTARRLQEFFCLQASHGVDAEDVPSYRSLPIAGAQDPHFRLQVSDRLLPILLGMGAQRISPRAFSVSNIWTARFFYHADTSLKLPF